MHKLPFGAAVLLILTRAGFAAEPPGRSVDTRAAVETSIALQRQSAASMAQSIATQQVSIGRQMRQSARSANGFLPIASWQTTRSVQVPALACNALNPMELDNLVTEAADREDLQPELLRSIIRQESGSNPCAISPKGAMGLMQLMPATAVEYGVRDPFDPRANVGAGARLLKKLLLKYDDIPMALGAYNAGPARVDKTGGIPEIPETVDYVNRILSLLSISPEK